MSINYNKQKINSLSNQIRLLEEKLEGERNKNENFSNLKHEVGRLNSLILSSAEKLNISSQNREDLIKTILYTSSMISSRMIYADLELNPQAFEQQGTFSCGIYKKFHKAHHILSNLANNHGKKINLQGPSHFSIQAVSAFDCLPFILLDNAVKYAPDNTEITVNFEENMSLNYPLNVKVESIGPLITTEKISQLTERGFRDEGALRTEIPGQGLGLYIAKQLCTLYDIEISFSSTEKSGMSMNNINYGYFGVHLKFRK